MTSSDEDSVPYTNSRSEYLVVSRDEIKRLSVINRQLKVTVWLLIIALVVSISGIMILLAKLAEVT